MTGSNARVLITLSVRPELEETLVDWLLLHPDAPGFTSVDAAGHGTNPEHLSRTEQVYGQQRRRLLLLMVGTDLYPQLLVALRERFSGVDALYWVTPIIDAGHFDASRSGEQLG